MGLAALTGAVTSEALYSSTQFASQVSTIVPALMVNILEVDISTLDMEFVLFVHSTHSALTDILAIGLQQ